MGRSSRYDSEPLTFEGVEDELGRPIDFGQADGAGPHYAATTNRVHDSGLYTVVGVEDAVRDLRFSRKLQWVARARRLSRLNRSSRVYGDYIKRLEVNALRVLNDVCKRLGLPDAACSDAAAVVRRLVESAPAAAAMESGTSRPRGYGRTQVVALFCAPLVGIIYAARRRGIDLDPNDVLEAVIECPRLPDLKVLNQVIEEARESRRWAVWRCLKIASLLAGVRVPSARPEPVIQRMVTELGFPWRVARLAIEIVRRLDGRARGISSKRVAAAASVYIAAKVLGHYITLKNHVLKFVKVCDPVARRYVTTIVDSMDLEVYME